MADGGKVIIKIDGDDKGFKSAMSKTKDIAGKAAKGIAVGVGAASAAIGAIGAQAVKAYAEYEQLAGGVETLFKDSANIVQNYANQAYQTAGMSANQYMETVTSFSASLLQSLGGDTAKAAEYGNQAVIDMSDNANKMGTSIEMIQNAYQGFAKQNYTMLDNLKLGYGGTKEEMQRLLADAEKISGVKYDISSFADITEAIHVIQTEMGITGTTAEEAATTIQGSLSMVKASWENLLTGLADPNADIDLLIDNVINSVMTLGGNLMPVIQAVLDKIPIMLDTLGGAIMQKIPEVGNMVLPELVNSASNLISTLANSLNTNADMIGDASLNILMTLVNAIISNLPVLLNTAMTLVLTLVQGLSDSLPELIPAAVDMIIEIVDALLDNLDQIIDVALELIIALAEGIVEALPKLAAKAPEIVVKLVTTLIKEAPKMAKAALELIVMLWNGLITYVKEYFKGWAKEIYDNIIQPIIDKGKEMLNAGKDLVVGLWNGINDKVEWLKSKVSGVVDKIKSWFTGKNGFDEHSPSKWSKKVFAYVIDGAVNGVVENKDKLIDAIGQLVKDNKTEVQKVQDEMNKELLDSEKKYNAESERLKDSKSEADKKYLENLKNIAEQERKIYDALQKDVANSQNAIMNSIKSFAEKAYDSIDKVSKAQESYANKLKGYVSFYNSSTGTLSDYRAASKQLKLFSQALEDVQKRGNVPIGFFNELREMPIDEGIKFATALANAPDKIFNEQIDAWSEYQKEAEKISKTLYSEEAKNAGDEVEQAFKELNADLDQQGQDNAEAWGNGFLEKVQELMPNIISNINAAFSGIVSGNQYAYAGAGTSNTYYSTYNIQPSSGESTQQQLWALKNAEFLKEQRGY